MSYYCCGLDTVYWSLLDKWHLLLLYHTVKVTTFYLLKVKVTTYRYMRIIKQWLVFIFTITLSIRNKFLLLVSKEVKTIILASEPSFFFFFLLKNKNILSVEGQAFEARETEKELGPDKNLLISAVCRATPIFSEKLVIWRTTLNKYPKQVKATFKENSSRKKKLILKGYVNVRRCLIIPLTAS